MSEPRNPMSQNPTSQQKRAHPPVAGGATAASGWLLRLSASATKPEAFISSTRHARAFVCGALAGMIGHAELYVSGGAEHQGPDGGGPVALIVDRSPT